MTTFFAILTILVLLGILIYIMSNVEYSLHIQRLSNNNTIEQIEDQIEKDAQAINSGKFSGHMLDNILDHKELWEQVKNYKITGKIK